MSDQFYIDLRSTADQILKEFGTDYKVYGSPTAGEITPGDTGKAGGQRYYDTATMSTVLVDDDADPDTPETPRKAPLIGTVRGVVDTNEAKSMFAGLAGSQQASPWIKWNSRRSLILSGAMGIEGAAEVEVDGRLFSLEKLSPVKPANIVVIYMLDLEQ